MTEQDQHDCIGCQNVIEMGFEVFGTSPINETLASRCAAYTGRGSDSTLTWRHSPRFFPCPRRLLGRAELAALAARYALKWSDG